MAGEGWRFPETLLLCGAFCKLLQGGMQKHFGLLSVCVFFWFGQVCVSFLLFLRIFSPAFFFWVEFQPEVFLKVVALGRRSWMGGPCPPPPGGTSGHPRVWPIYDIWCVHEYVYIQHKLWFQTCCLLLCPPPQDGRAALQLLHQHGAAPAGGGQGGGGAARETPPGKRGVVGGGRPEASHAGGGVLRSCSFLGLLRCFGGF